MCFTLCYYNNAYCEKLLTIIINKSSICMLHYRNQFNNAKMSSMIILIYTYGTPLIQLPKDPGPPEGLPNPKQLLSHISLVPHSLLDEHGLPGALGGSNGPGQDTDVGGCGVVFTTVVFSGLVASVIPVC